MYTKEDIENLAQFLHLTLKQIHWEKDIYFPEWNNLEVDEKESFRTLARVALDFKMK